MNDRTLRDRFPVTCTVCRQVIQPRRDEEGKIVAEGEAYVVVGMTRTADNLPVCVYRHKSCHAS